MVGWRLVVPVLLILSGCVTIAPVVITGSVVVGVTAAVDSEVTP